MQQFPPFWSDPISHLLRQQPDVPVLYLSPQILQATARRFRGGFPGLVTYAVKANDRPEVLDNLVAAGIDTFDVASPSEMAAARRAFPQAVLHYNNPVRSRDEVAAGIANGVASWAVDDPTELSKLADVPKSAELAVRIALPVKGAAYDFGAKFGATPDLAVELLRRVDQGGWHASVCFHPGTQCEDPRAWAAYITEAARICERAGVTLARLNVGGGFAADRCGKVPDLNAVFSTIRAVTDRVFTARTPALLCEPGRALVAEAFTLATRIKGMRAGGRTIYLNDGIYGGLSELRDMGLSRRIRVIAVDGTMRQGAPIPRVVFGPTCDSLDRLPDGLVLPADAQDGDYVLFDGLGAYSVAISTDFNGYGLHDIVSVQRLTGNRNLPA
ncbi:type III PLP-dependent enzyme [Pontibaca salina]|uniref:ornithine decarboxylase n=1 Tax=Pontibaca salina TaxID=2795731 RepID=A0A934HJW6_9RHOB|nr:type III PLP-dependent enzyme [Pontibaca salina]MBI6629539.1 type III PLP-dependent enzyme [Pontibaca salina]